MTRDIAPRSTTAGGGEWWGKDAVTHVLTAHIVRREVHSSAIVGCSCGWYPHMGTSPLAQWAEHVAGQIEAVLR